MAYWKYFLTLNNQEKQGHQKLYSKFMKLSITLLKLVKPEHPTAIGYFMLSHITSEASTTTRSTRILSMGAT